MKKFLLFFVMAAIACSCCIVAFAARQTTIHSLSATKSTRTIAVGSFTKLDVNRVDVKFTPGRATGKVILTAPENIVDLIEVRVKGSTLEIGLKDGVNYNHGSLNAVAEVTAPWLSDIEASLSAKVAIASDMTVKGDFDIDAGTSAKITAPSITVAGDCDLDAGTSALISVTKLTVSGKADMEATTSAVINLGRLDASKADFDASTSGVIEVEKGTCRVAKYDASTSGVVKASGLVADEATADASTGGSIKVNSKNLRKSSSSTGGSIKQTGN